MESLGELVQSVALLTLAWLAARHGSGIRKLEDKVNALAKGSEPQGVREEERDTRKPYVLPGHWHKGEWWNGDTGPNRKWRETYPQHECKYVVSRVAYDCPKRNPFSTL